MPCFFETFIYAVGVYCFTKLYFGLDAIYDDHAKMKRKLWEAQLSLMAAEKEKEEKEKEEEEK